MARVISDQQYKAVTSLPGADRYSHFIRQVADWEAVWSLRDDDGWRLVGDSVGGECVPVWPHERYASAYAKGRLDGCRPEAISIDDWLKKWLPGIKERGWHVAVFPIDGERECGVVVPPEQIETDLNAELAQYE